MAYVTRPALVPADFGYPPEKVVEKPKSKPKPKEKLKVKVPLKKKVSKKPIVKAAKKGRALPWKV